MEYRVWTRNKTFAALMLGVLLLVGTLLPGCEAAQQPQTSEPTAPPVAQTQPSPPQTQPPTEPEPEPTAAPTEPPLPLNRFAPDDFGYLEEGGYLTCLTEDCVMGIDVSKYQAKVDWEQVKAAGFEFVMIRIGGRGYGETGSIYADNMAKEHYKGAKAAGLQVGVYFFSQAVNVTEALEEARYALKQTKNWELDLPIVFDWEYISETARTANVDRGMLTTCAIAFCDTVRAAGRDAMIYYSPWFGHMNLACLEDYPLWVALYKEEMTFPYRFTMWQYTCTGVVPGIEGDVDINLYFPNT